MSGVNALVASSSVHPNVAASSDRGEESRADFLMTVWILARRTFPSKALVSVFSPGSLTFAFCPSFRGRPPHEPPTCNLAIVTMSSAASAITRGILACISPSLSRLRPVICACIAVPFSTPCNCAAVTIQENVCAARSDHTSLFFNCCCNVNQCRTMTGTLHCKTAGKTEFCIIMEEDEYISAITYDVDAVCTTMG